MTDTHSYTADAEGQARLLRHYRKQLHDQLFDNAVCAALANLQRPPVPPDFRPSFLPHLFASYGIDGMTSPHARIEPHSAEQLSKWAELIHEAVYESFDDADRTPSPQLKDGELEQIKKEDLTLLNKDLVAFNEALPLLMPMLVRHYQEHRKGKPHSVRIAQHAKRPLQLAAVEEYWVQRMERMLKAQHWPLGEIPVPVSLDEADGRLDSARLASLPDRLAELAKDEGYALKAQRQHHPLARLMPKDSYRAHWEDIGNLDHFAHKAKQAEEHYKRLCASPDASEGQTGKAKAASSDLDRQLLTLQKQITPLGPLDELAELDANRQLRPLIEAIRQHHHGETPVKPNFEPMASAALMAISQQWIADAKALGQRLMFAKERDMDGEFETRRLLARKIELLEIIGGPMTLIAHQDKLLREIAKAGEAAKAEETPKPGWSHRTQPGKEPNEAAWVIGA